MSVSLLFELTFRSHMVGCIVFDRSVLILMGLVRIRPHSSHGISNQPSQSVDSSGWQAKNAASIEF